MYLKFFWSIKFSPDKVKLLIAWPSCVLNNPGKSTAPATNKEYFTNNSMNIVHL